MLSLLAVRLAFSLAGMSVSLSFLTPTDWHDREVIQPLVSGVAHACHKKYKTRSEAEEAFQIALSQGKVHVL